MPLSHGHSAKSFSKNIATEMHEGKPLKQSLAIAYAMKKKAHKAHGGEMEKPCDEHGEAMCHMCHGGEYAKGGLIEEEEKETGYMPDPMEHPDHMYGHAVENQGDEGEDMIGHIMKKRMMMSKGGMVANDTPDEADFDKNDFDDLALHDHLEDHYTGKDSGDELGDEQEDEDRRDVVSQIMRSRRKKMGHNPRPA